MTIRHEASALPTQRAFTLVELAIVLVVLGLVVGGIISAQSLIRAAQLRETTEGFNRYSTAVYAFQDKYASLPGDMDDATRYWGAAAGGTAKGIDNACAALLTASTTATTCNGNGNDQIGEATLVVLDDRLQFYELYRSWQHLKNAGLIEGSYAGVSYNGRNVMVSIGGNNTPKSKLHATGNWNIRYIQPNLSGAGWYADGWGRNLLILSSGNYSVDPIVSPEEAWKMDTKIDDGKPGMGALMSYTSFLNPNCTTSDVSTAEYLLTNTAITCTLVFKLK